jgi:hypothetical protein
MDLFSNLRDVRIFDDFCFWRCTPGTEIVESLHMQLTGDQVLKLQCIEPHLSTAEFR